MFISKVQINLYENITFQADFFPLDQLKMGKIGKRYKVMPTNVTNPLIISARPLRICSFKLGWLRKDLVRDLSEVDFRC